MQELAALRSQLTGTVNVEVDAAPQQDLNRVLEEIRAQYEAITDKHRRDQEAWFNDKVREKILMFYRQQCRRTITSHSANKRVYNPRTLCTLKLPAEIPSLLTSVRLCISPQSTALTKEVAISTESIQTSKTEISDLRRTLQGLEIELQSQLSMVRMKKPPPQKTGKNKIKTSALMLADFFCLI